MEGKRGNWNSTCHKVEQIWHSLVLILRSSSSWLLLLTLLLPLGLESLKIVPESSHLLLEHHLSRRLLLLLLVTWLRLTGSQTIGRGGGRSSWGPQHIQPTRGAGLLSLEPDQ